MIIINGFLFDISRFFDENIIEVFIFILALMDILFINKNELIGSIDGKARLEIFGN